MGSGNWTPIGFSKQDYTKQNLNPLDQKSRQNKLEGFKSDEFKGIKKNVPSPIPPLPQASKAPDLAAIRNSMAGAGQAGGSPGVAQTFLTGAGGVDPSTLDIGRTLLLGA